MSHLKNWVFYPLLERFFIFLIFSQFFSYSLLAQKLEDPSSSYKPTQITEILEFKDISSSYTVGYGYEETGRQLIPLAIYDKTFPNFGNRKQILHLLLASIGVGDFNLNEIISKVKKHHHKRKRKVLKDLIADDFLKTIKKKNSNIIYPHDWWKNPNLKWKEKCKSILEEEKPKRIPLDCLVLKRSSFEDRIAKKVHSIVFRFLFEEDTWIDVQKASYFYRKDDGNYELIVSEKEKKLAPTKIIDLRGYNSSFKKAYSWSIQTTLLKTLISQIPLPPYPQIVVAILENFFNYIEVLTLFKQSEALILLIEAYHGNKNSPFYGNLNEDQIKYSIRYLRRGEVFISSVIKNIFQKKELLADNYLKSCDEKSKKNFNYLEKKGYDLTQLGESYALASKKDETGKLEELKVFSLLKRKTFRRRPHSVVDFLNPKKDYAKRTILNGLLVGMNFIYIPIPVVPTLIKLFYKELFIREMQRYQAHEGGFRSFTDYHRDEIKKALEDQNVDPSKIEQYMTSIYEIIKLRSLNPLILTQEEREVRKKQSEQWISSHYKNYTPF